MKFFVLLFFALFTVPVHAASVKALGFGNISGMTTTCVVQGSTKAGLSVRADTAFYKALVLANKTGYKNYSTTQKGQPIRQATFWCADSNGNARRVKVIYNNGSTPAAVMAEGSLTFE